MATLIVLLGAEHGWWVGAAAGLGAATVDACYATVALLAGAVLAPQVQAHRAPLVWTSAAVLVIVAIVLARPVWRRDAPVEAGRVPARPARPGAWRSFSTVLGLTAVNPTTLVYFAALVAGPAAGAARSVPQRAAFVVGAFVASATWQLVLAGAGTAVGGILTGPRGRRWTAALGATLVAALAVRTALSA